jgi:hypothetical protein
MAIAARTSARMRTTPQGRAQPGPAGTTEAHMVSRKLLSLSLVAALSGCTGLMMNKSPTQWQSCDTAGGTSERPAVCRLDVQVSGSCPGATIDLDKLDIALSGSRPAHVVWRLPEGYAFCAAYADGAYLKFFDATEQFSDPVTTDDENGARLGKANKCTKFFRLRNENNPQTAGKTYVYYLQFTDTRNRTTCRTDPQIQNG